MGTQKQKFTGDAKQLERVIEQLRRQQLKLEEQIVKTGKQSEKVGRAASRSQTMIGRGLNGLILRYGSVGQAIQIVNNHLRNQVEIAKEAKRLTTTVGDSQAAIIANIGDASTSELRKFTKEMAKIQKDAKFQSLAPINTAAASLLSTVERNKVAPILRVTAPFMTATPDQLPTVAGAVGDVSDLTGLNAKQSMAFMLAVQARSRFEQASGFKNVAAILEGAKQDQPALSDFESSKQAAALFAAISSTVKDVEGSLTKTATAALISNTAKLLPNEKSLDARLQKIRQSSELQQKLLEMGGFRAAMQSPIRSLISDANSKMSKAFADNLKNIRVDEGIVDRKLKQLETGTLQRALTTLDKQSKGINERLLTQSTAGARGQARDIFEDTLRKTKVSIDQGAQGVVALTTFDAIPTTTGAIEGAMRLLRERRTQQYSPAGTATRFLGPFGGLIDFASAGTFQYSDDTLPENRRLNVERIDAQLKVLQEIRDIAARRTPTTTTHDERD